MQRTIAQQKADKQVVSEPVKKITKPKKKIIKKKVKK